jgi:hypothetical protein
MPLRPLSWDGPTEQSDQVDIRSFPTAPSQSALFAVASAVGIAFPGMSKASHQALIVPLSAPLSSVAAEVYGRVRLKFYKALDIDAGGRVSRTPAAVLECLDPALLPAFCSLCMDIVTRSRAPLFGSDIRAIVNEWRDLLRSQPRLSIEGEVGLWGELQLLLLCPSLDGALAAWHGPDAATLDFFGGGIGLECKTARGTHRHRFSLDQGSSAAFNQNIYLVSLVISEDATKGETVAELVDEIRSRISGDHRFEKKLLGTGFRSEQATSYETRFTLCEVWTLPMSRVPRVRAIDPGVSEVRYTVDLQHLHEHRLDSAAATAVLASLSRSFETAKEDKP